MTKLKARDRAYLSAAQFAFPTLRKEPLENASHVRNAVARFNQVTGINDAERDVAWTRIKTAAKKIWRRALRDRLATATLSMNKR